MSESEVKGQGFSKGFINRDGSSEKVEMKLSSNFSRLDERDGFSEKM